MARDDDELPDPFRENNISPTSNSNENHPSADRRPTQRAERNEGVEISVDEQLQSDENPSEEERDVE